MKKFAFLICSFFSFSSALALSTTTFNYSMNAKATGAGTVYVDDEETFNPSRVTNLTNQTGSYDVTSTSSQSSAKLIVFLDALPDPGYGFKQWRKVNANNETLSTIGSTRKVVTNETLGTTASNNVFYYQADFEETFVSVGSENPSDCQVFISKEINKIGDKVILTASTNKDCLITWKKDGTVVSTANPLELTVTEKAHYTASAEATTKLAGGYYRIRNANPNNDYKIKLADNWFDMTSLCGSITSVQTERPSKINNARNVLKRDIKLNTNVTTDPSSILYIKNNSNNNYLLYSQGTQVKEITKGTHHGSVAINYNGCDIKILRAGDVYSLSAHIYASQSGYGIDLGNMYFYDDNNVFSVKQVDDDYRTKWYIEPINDNNYFAADFTNAVQFKNKYYTTLRLPFNAKIPSGSNLKAYSVTEYPASTDGNATTSVYQAGHTIPAGLPVVIENTSSNPQDCILIPDGDPSSYISSSVANSTSGVTTGITTVLYNKYGKHSHDTHRDQIGTGDSIGYFTQTYKNSTPIYKLGVKDGRVGFWTAVANGETVYGNTAYATQECALFPIDEMELKTVVKDGFENTAYKVSNNLYGVTVAGGKLYAKDYGLYANPSTKPDEAIDYMQRAGMQACDDYDQSNWVALNVENPDSYVGKDLSVTGTLLRKPNPEMTVTKITATDPEQSGYMPNVYIPASFMGETQTSTVGNQETFFFVTPKPQEYAHITWAVYGGDGKFYIAAPEGSINQAALKGGFVADGSLIGGLTSFKSGKTYEFDAIIMRNTPSKADPYTGGGLNTDWVVYPLTADEVITAVSDVNTSKTVTGIKYYNLAGMASDVPFDGINIRVTTYSDGTRQASKIRF